MRYADEPQSGPLHFGCLDHDREWVNFVAPTAPKAEPEGACVEQDTMRDINKKIFAECARIGASASNEGIEEQARSMAELRRFYALACLLIDPGSRCPRIRNLASERPWEWHVTDPDATDAVVESFEFDSPHSGARRPMSALFHDSDRLRNIISFRGSHALRFLDRFGPHVFLRGRRHDLHIRKLLEMLIELDSPPPIWSLD